MDGTDKSVSWTETAPMKKKWWYWGIVVVLFIAGFSIARYESGNPAIVKRTRIALGTVVEIQVRSRDVPKPEEAISKAFAEIQRVEMLLSPYEPSSPVWQINHSDEAVIQVLPEIYSLLEYSDWQWRISKGAFDVSLGALVEAWGFNGDSPSIPAEEAWQNAIKQSGWDKVTLEGDDRLRRSMPVWLDFGAIGKGYAVDRAIEVLQQNGMPVALVNAGGEIRAADGEWLIGIQHPRLPDRLIGKIKLEKGMAVATSGDYQHFFEQNGVRYHHILDPMTGFPAANAQSVTILAPECTAADALATAVFVLGPERGMELVERLANTEAIIVNGAGEITQSTGFYKYWADN